MGYKHISISGGDTGAPLNAARRIGLIAEHVEVADKFILDCGCGSGEYVEKLSGYSKNVYGIEYDRTRVAHFKSLNILPENVSVGNIESMKFHDCAFDLVLLNEVLEHIPNPKKGLEEVSRVLKRNGHLVIMSPNRCYPFETHGVIIKSSQVKLPNYIPFVPYIPLRLGELFLTYQARNYFPLDLKQIIEQMDFKILEHGYISQTFEGIGGNNNQLYQLLRPALRKLFFRMEKIPFFNKFFCVSQFLIAVKQT
mgnify:CR=1 FL=1